MWSPRIGALPFITSIGPHRGLLTMAFPRSRSTSEMVQYVIRNFKWDRREVAFLPLPLPNDFQAMCQSYDLAITEGATRCFELPELPQVIFYAILLSEAERLGVLHWWTLHVTESVLTQLHWSTFESWVYLKGDWILKARFREEAEHRKRSCKDHYAPGFYTYQEAFVNL
ncbi:hypothetical protein Cgig2_028578 [Carnegiea gigantea]|uniref:Uncharacterized protein n=1 Tax=Carnegiea gigantea TaxID=171969 RepID=A0A9Q1QCK5_9CARY|nr:hypothetical protein Cgig2_028578 [Carnegiea gigantea]